MIIFTFTTKPLIGPGQFSRVNAVQTSYRIKLGQKLTDKVFLVAQVVLSPNNNGIANENRKYSAYELVQFFISLITPCY